MHSKSSSGNATNCNGFWWNEGEVVLTPYVYKKNMTFGLCPCGSGLKPELSDTFAHLINIIAYTASLLVFPA